MDEIVYLSDAKLKNVIPSNPPWWRRLRAGRVTAEIGVGPVKLGTSVKMPKPGELEALAESLKKADVLGETAKWFEDPTLTAGELILFEGRFGCHRVTFGPAPDAVLFCQLPAPNCRSVVLHGSAANVPAWRQTATASAPVPYSDPTAVPDILRAAVASGTDSALWGFWHDLGRNAAPVTADALTQNLTALYRDVVDAGWFRASAGYFTGFAYVSGIVPLPDGTEIVLASPLYVKRARPET